METMTILCDWPACGKPATQSYRYNEEPIEGGTRFRSKHRCDEHPFHDKTKRALQRLNKLLREYGDPDLYGAPIEACEPVNNASRELVEAFAQDHGEAWLGNVNCYRPEDFGLKRWDGEPVPTFGAAFVVPRADAELERLIRERHEPTSGGEEAESMASNAKSLDRILDHIERSGGVHLVWS